ncbi:MAG: type 2 isopentenyl-diphosphate Delta-isomerase [Candidatus Micrarchaeota archaeon]|nr:MAG: type 2 isopentenyl-diphosphate Delta-isomerase [Candidatus Micrarchaeota archaeon]
MSKAERDKKVEEIMRRKEEHIKICLDEEVNHKQSTLFDDIKLINNPLPELDIDDIDTRIEFFGKEFSMPFMVGAMTGGARLAQEINKRIAKAIDKKKLGMALGSQRAALYDKRLEVTYTVSRKYAPKAFIGANIGGAQIAKKVSIEDIKRLIDMLDADALYIHLNPAQELVQPEGDPYYNGVKDSIEKIVDSIDKPVIVKEVGSGISKEVAVDLEKIGVSAIEIAGAGGTSYTAVEYYRAVKYRDPIKAEAAKTLWSWGIPTAAALIAVRKAVKIPVIASGGLRNGLDIAKALILGADMTAMAGPILKAAYESEAKLMQLLNSLEYQLKAVMMLTGSRSIKDLRKARYVIVNELKDWVDQYAR